MREPIKLGDVLQELMALIMRRRKLKVLIKEGQASEMDRTELEAINTGLAE